MSEVTRRNLFRFGTTALAGSIVLPPGRYISEEHRKQVLDCLGENITIGWKLFHRVKPSQILAISQAQIHLMQLTDNFLPCSTRCLFYSSLYNLAGMAMNLQGHYKQAIRTHRYAYNAALEADNHLEIARSLICLANDFRGLNNPAQAINCIEAALSIIGHREDETYLKLEAHLLGCWANAALMKGEISVAHQILDKSAILIEKTGADEEFDKASWLQLKGKAAFQTGDYQSAIQLYEKALLQVPSTSLIRQALILLPLIISYACTGERDMSLLTAEKAANTVIILDAPTISKQFIDATQAMLLLFPHEPSVQTFVRHMEHHFSL